MPVAWQPNDAGVEHDNDIADDPEVVLATAEPVVGPSTEPPVAETVEATASLWTDGGRMIDAILVTTVEVVVLIAVVVLLGLVARVLAGRVRTLSANETFIKQVDALRRGVRLILTLLGVFGVVGLVLANSWLVWRNIDPGPYTLDLIGSVSAEHWWALGYGVLRIAAAIVGAAIGVRVVRRVTTAVDKRVCTWGQVKANDESVHTFFNGLSRALCNSVWLLVVILAAYELRVPEWGVQWLLDGVAVYLIIAIGLLIVRATAVVVDTLDAVSTAYAENKTWGVFYQRLKPLVPFFRRCLEYGLWIGTASLVLAQLEPINALAAYGPGLIQAIGVFFLGRVVIEIGHLLIDRWAAANNAKLDDVERRRRETILPLVKTVFKQIAYFVVFVLALSAVGFDPMPLLAGAGIIGMVIGLGAQPLINDVVSGFFILFENIFLVGDFVEIGDAKGTVEAVDFRTSRIRDIDGRIHVVRNGEMRQVINYSKEYTCAVVEVGVSYAADLDQVEAALVEAGANVANGTADVLEPLAVRGIVEFDDSAVIYRTVTKVRPATHGEIAMRLRREIKRLFDQRGIEIPFPQRTVHQLGDRPGPHSDTVTPATI